jgi:hypothetical protein
MKTCPFAPKDVRAKTIQEEDSKKQSKLKCIAATVERILEFCLRLLLKNPVK